MTTLRQSAGMYAVFTVVRVLEMTGLEMGPEEWIEFA